MSNKPTTTKSGTYHAETVKLVGGFPPKKTAEELNKLTNPANRKKAPNTAGV